MGYNPGTASGFALERTAPEALPQWARQADMWPYADWMEQLYRLLKPTDQYFAQWVHFRNGLIYRQGGGYLLYMVPAFGISGFISYYCFNTGYAMVIGMFVGWFAMLIGLFRHQLICPRCKRQFYGHIWERNHPTRERCMYCGLQLYAPHSDL